jgi:hypothetical protein
MKRKRRPWTDRERATLARLYPDTRTNLIACRMRRSIESINGKAALLGLRKSAAYLASPAACRLRRGEHPGKATQFRKGHVPANKGLRRPGYAPGRMAETQFRKGERSGVAVALYRPIGAERISKEGYLERKINDDLPLQRRWRAVHLLIWEAAHGPVPPGHAACFRNGDKADLRLANLEIVSRRELMLRNSVHNLPKPLAEVVQLRGALIRQINRRAAS